MDHCVRQVEVQPKSLNRSREVSLVEQCTIDCECLANFLPKKVKKNKTDIMQLFSADATYHNIPGPKGSSNCR